MDVIKTLFLWAAFSPLLFGQQIVIEGDYKPVQPTLQPSVDIVSPFAFTVDVNPDQTVSWTWTNGLQISKPEETRLEVSGGKGVYQVGCIIRTFRIVDGQIQIDRDTQEIVFSIGNAKQPTPGDPDQPDIPPDGDYQSFTDLARKAASQMGDSATASALGKFYTEWAAGADPDGSLTVLRYEVRRGVGNVLFDNNKDDKDWENGWRVPASDALSKLKTSPEYIAAIKACGIGFTAGASNVMALQTAARPPPTIRKAPIATLIFYTSNNPNFKCEPCDLWKEIDKPKFEQLGVEVIERKVAGSVPRFLYISPKGREFKYFGRLRFETFRTLVTKTTWREN